MYMKIHIGIRHKRQSQISKNYDFGHLFFIDCKGEEVTQFERICNNDNNSFQDNNDLIVKKKASKIALSGLLAELSF